MRKMTTIMNLAAAAALAGILLTGCSTEADETTAATTAAEAETTTAAAGESAETTEGGTLSGKKISAMTPYLTSVTTNQMAGYIKEDLEAEGAEVFVIDTANDFAELASRIEDVVSSGTDGIVLVSADPNQAVDVATRQEIHRLLREEAEKGKAVLYVSSDLTELLEIADEVAVMAYGKVRKIFENKDRKPADVLACCYEAEREENDR